MIIDCFTFFNELAILELRLKELSPVVDKFVLVEATKTQSLRNKPLFFEEHKHLFKDFLHKIVHIIVDDMPEDTSLWGFEFFQRRCIRRGLQKLELSDSDWVLISDLDEVPNPNILKSLDPSSFPLSFGMDYIVYKPNLRVKNFQWRGTVVNLWRDIKDADCHQVIKTRDNMPESRVLNRAGWHFGYQGGPKAIHYKYFSAVEPYDKTSIPPYELFLQIFNERAVDEGFFIYSDNLDRKDLQLEKVTNLTELPKSLMPQSNRSSSQAGQDRFALIANKYKHNGFFVDLGCNEPEVCNNSNVLEKDFQWRGILVDFNQGLVNKCAANRSNVCLCEDLMSKSVTQILDENNAPAVIDYLSLDLDDGATMAALRSIDFDKYQFRCVTFEHDAYLRGEEIREPSREIFEKAGYHLLCKNVKFNGGAFEDWYVKKELINFDAISALQTEDKEGSQIVSGL